MDTVKIGSADALDPASGEVGSPPPASTFAVPDVKASAAADQASSLEGVRERRAAMPPILLGQDMADGLGATIGSVVLVTTSPQGELTPFGMVAQQ